MIKLSKIKVYVGNPLKINKESIFYEKLTQKMNDLFKEFSI